MNPSEYVTLPGETGIGFLPV